MGQNCWCMWAEPGEAVRGGWAASSTACTTAGSASPVPFPPPTSVAVGRGTIGTSLFPEGHAVWHTRRAHYIPVNELLQTVLRLYLLSIWRLRAVCDTRCWVELFIPSEQFSNLNLSNNEWKLLLLGGQWKLKHPGTRLILTKNQPFFWVLAGSRSRTSLRARLFGMRNISQLWDYCSQALGLLWQWRSRLIRPHLHLSQAWNSCEKQKWFMPLKVKSPVLVVLQW